MKLTERILVMLIIIGVLLRFFDVSGGAMVQLIGSLGLAAYYIAFTLFIVHSINFLRILKRSSYEGMKTGTVLLAIVSGLIFGVALLGILFTTMGWVASGIMYFYSVVLLIVLFTILLILFLNNKTPVKRQLLMRATALLGILLLLKLVEYTLLT